MKLFTLLFLLHRSLAQFPFAGISEILNEKKCVIDNRSAETMWEYKLRHDLEDCGYNSFKPPVPNGTDPLKVSVHFSLKSFKFDSKLQEFSTFMWTFFSWQDDRLKWDPAKYGNITTIIISSWSIWAPSIRIVNNIADDFYDTFFYVLCDLESTGTLQCIAWKVYEAKCSTDLRDWPYDSQYCDLEFELHAEVATRMQLHAPEKAITMIGSEYGTEWDIMDYEQKMNVTSEKQLIMKFRLDRHAEVLAAIVIYPSLILSILTCSSLFLDVRLKLRLLVICFSLLCHNYFITDLSFEMPDNTKDPPSLLLYYRGSFILTSSLLILSFILSFLCRKKVLCPTWMTSINNFVFSKKVCLIKPRWENKIKEDINNHNLNKDWTDFSNIVNSICILISIVVYTYLYCVFMPHPIPYEY